MLKIGLTGSIAMGKSATSKMFAEQGVPIFDADAMVHVLYQKGYQGFETIKALCPEATMGNEVDRKILSAHILKNQDTLKSIEKTIHPLLREIENEFFNQSAKSGKTFIVFDVPLLFEMKSHENMDKIIVCSTTPEIQKQRAMQRDGMTQEKFEFILSKQMPDDEKKQYADYIIDTSISLEDAKQQVINVINEINKLG